MTNHNENELEEQLAALFHRVWTHWMKFMCSRAARRRAKGVWTLPEPRPVVFELLYEDVARWERQMETSYEELSEDEKDSDRHQAHKVMKVLDKLELALWVKVDQADNAYCGIYTRQEKLEEEKVNPPSDTNYFWEKLTFSIRDFL